MFEYSTRVYGSPFSGEKNGLKIQNLVVELLSKNHGLYGRSHGLCGVETSVSLTKANTIYSVSFGQKAWT